MVPFDSLLAFTVAALVLIQISGLLGPMGKSLADLTGSARLTADNVVSGTPAYMSPEQAVADPDLDARSDLYSLGAILFFWLTGRPPFEGQNAAALMIAHARDPVERPSTFRAGIPADLERVVLRCLAKRADDRYPDARALDEALAACEAAPAWDAEQAGRWWAERVSAEVGRPPMTVPAGHPLDGLVELPVDLARQHLRLAHGELVALAAHELDEDRELQLAAALHLPGVGPLRVAHAERDVADELRPEPRFDESGGDLVSVQPCQR